MLRIRVSTLAGIGALALVGGTIVAPPVSASAAPLILSAIGSEGQNLQVAAEAGFSGLLPNEFIEFAQLNSNEFVIGVRQDTDVDTTDGRPLLFADPSSLCQPKGVASVELSCRTNPIRSTQELRVDMSQLTGYMQFVMIETKVASPISLNFMGGSGVDEVYAGSGNDSIQGGAGADLLFGGPGDDLIVGGPGNDLIEGESGRDDMRGGSGRNRIDAADGIADLLVDCGGVPEFLDFDKGKDVPVNCADGPVPVPPAPVTPSDPVPPGEADGTVDGQHVPVEVPRPQSPTDPVGGKVVSFKPMIFSCSLKWVRRSPSEGDQGSLVPGFPALAIDQRVPTFDWNWATLLPGSQMNLSVFPGEPNVEPVSAQSSVGIPLASLRANAQGVVNGPVPVPQGQLAGNYILQVNGITADSLGFTVNLGVLLTQDTPAPEPGPDESINIISAKRGKGKNAAVIKLQGATTGLTGTSVTPRYRIQGKKWLQARPLRVTDNGSFRWRLKTTKSVRIVVTSGAIKSTTVKVAAVRKR